jgi:hypothetical protein
LHPFPACGPVAFDRGFGQFQCIHFLGYVFKTEAGLGVIKREIVQITGYSGEKLVIAYADANDPLDNIVPLAFAYLLYYQF